MLRLYFVSVDYQFYMARFKLVLIIDDNEMDNFVIQTMVERVNLAESVFTATNVFNALEYVQSVKRQARSGKFQPEEIAIFLDIMMPIMDGDDFLKSLEKIWPDLLPRVYLLSGLPVEEHELHVKNKLVAGNIEKPLTEGRLREIFFPNDENVNISQGKRGK